MLRSKEQPGVQKFATLPELDHEIGTRYVYFVHQTIKIILGQETFTIETPFHGSFQVNAYMDCDSPEDIAQKVYSITDIPVPFITLYVR